MKKMLVVKFRIAGDLCALSHRQTLTMWQRVLMRSGLSLRYSRGFNPRPKISLPLPRAVGVQTDADLLQAELADQTPEVSAEALRTQLDSILPAGCRVTDIQIAEGAPRFAAAQAEYLFERSEDLPACRWTEQIDRCRREHASGRSILQQRRTPRHKSKTVDIQPYIEEITGNQNTLRIRCRIEPAGSVRVEELLQWFGIGLLDLAAPPRRTAVAWIQN